MRPVLEEAMINPNATKSIENFHPHVVKEVQDALKIHEWVGA